MVGLVRGNAELDKAQVLAHLGAPKTLQTPALKNGMISGPCDQWKREIKMRRRRGWWR